MFKHILVPLEGSRLTSRRSIPPQACRLLWRKVTALTVSRRTPSRSWAKAMVDLNSPAQWKSPPKSVKLRARQKNARQRADDQIRLGHKRTNRIWASSRLRKRKMRLDCHVLSRAAGVAALLLGSGNNQVLTHTKLPVLVVGKSGPRRGVKKRPLAKHKHWSGYMRHFYPKHRATSCFVTDTSMPAAGTAGAMQGPR